MHPICRALPAYLVLESEVPTAAIEWRTVGRSFCPGCPLVRWVQNSGWCTPVAMSKTCHWWVCIIAPFRFYIKREIDTPRFPCRPLAKTARPAAAAASAAASTSAFYGRPAVACPIKAAGGGAAAATWRGGGGRGLRMAESETLEVTLKKPMGLVLEENVGGFGGLRVKEIADGGSAQVCTRCVLL